MIITNSDIPMCCINEEIRQLKEITVAVAFLAPDDRSHRRKKKENDASREKVPTTSWPAHDAPNEKTDAQNETGAADKLVAAAIGEEWVESMTTFQETVTKDGKRPTTAIFICMVLATTHIFFLPETFEQKRKKNAFN